MILKKVGLTQHRVKTLLTGTDIGQSFFSLNHPTLLLKQKVNELKQDGSNHQVEAGKQRQTKPW